MARTSEVVGTVLGSRDLDAGMRWEHLADDEAACQAIKTSVLIHHILPQVHTFVDNVERGRAAARLGGRLCTRAGVKALLVPGTPRWNVCVELAQHLGRQDGEGDAEYAERCRRHDAWAAARPFEKAGIVLLLLRQAVVFLCGVDLFAGVPPVCLASASTDALQAHLRVPPILQHPVGCALGRICDSSWGELVADAVDRPSCPYGDLALRVCTATSKGGDGGGGRDTDGATSPNGAVGSAEAGLLSEAVRGILTSDAEATVDEVCRRLMALGLRADKKPIKRLCAWHRTGAPGLRDVTSSIAQPVWPSAATRAGSRTSSAREHRSMAGTVEAFMSDTSAWLQRGGEHGTGNGTKMRRLSLLRDRLGAQKSADDFDGAVDTWLEAKLGKNRAVRATRLERSRAADEAHAFFSML